MEISSNPYASAYQGIQAGFKQLDQDSAVLANPNEPDKTQELVNLKQDETQTQASAKALKTADDMIGTLIDIMA